MKRVMKPKGIVKRPGVGLACYVLKESCVLLGVRKGSHGAGTLAPPGGHLEFMEEFEDCFYNELSQETGLGRENVRLIDKYPIAVTNDFFPEGKHYVTLVLRGEHVSGEPRVVEPDKCEGWYWYEWRKLGDGLFVPVKNLKDRGFDLFG